MTNIRRLKVVLRQPTDAMRGLAVDDLTWRYLTGRRSSTTGELRAIGPGWPAGPVPPWAGVAVCQVPAGLRGGQQRGIL